jgi:hypothetical protein
MLLTNRYSFFDKKGLNSNPLANYAIDALIVQPDNGAGNGAVIHPYTNSLGSIIYIEILSGGYNYAVGTYIQLYDTNTQQLITCDVSDVTIVNGVITAVSIPSTPYNTNFSYPAVYYYTANYMEPVSTGLIASDSLFMLENVFDSNGKSVYTFPRAEYYGPYNITSYGANGTSAFIKIYTVPISGNVIAEAKNKIFGVNPATFAQLQASMNVEGPGIPANTIITEIDVTYNTITLSNDFVSVGAVSIAAYFPHAIRKGNTIRLDSQVPTALDGEHIITDTTSTFIFFDSTLNIPTTSAPNTDMFIQPVFRAQLQSGSDEEFFLFDVEYNEDYPTIVKSKEVYFTFNNADGISTPDSIPTTGNGLYQRTVYERPPQEALQINIGLQADYEGVYSSQLWIQDITFPISRLVYIANYEGETIEEEYRFPALLENFGTEVDAKEEFIFRDSDINEELPNYELLNSKRKEMLMEWSNIWPYAGSYRGLVNVLNWFGYYDVRIKEYWLNVNQEDEYYGSYRQMQVPFQLKDKAKNSEAISILPSKHYKKTNLFGLYYDIVKDGGQYYQNGIPITKDAFDFTNEEVLIKLFALKRYLKEKFLPLNIKIVDITGEGVYYENYAVNTWNDNVQRLHVNLTRDIDFTADSTRVQIKDARPFESNGGLPSPPYFGLVSNYYRKYNIDRALIGSGGGPYFGVIPAVSFPGESVQQARGVVRVKGYPLSIIAPLTPSGTGYQIGDVITLAGGSYEAPIRLVVNTVGPAGEVLNFGIVAGNNQGSNYSSLPNQFSQAGVIRISGNQYVAANAFGFIVNATDIPFEAESILLYDKGLKYSAPPIAVFQPAIGGITADLQLSYTIETPSAYFNNGAIVKAYGDSPNIPIAALLDLSTNFDIDWDGVPYTWNELGGGSDATLKSWASLLPNGTGQLNAVEILSPGKDYRITPTFTVSGGGGTGATVSGEILRGELKILEFEVTAVGSSLGVNDVLTLSPPIATSGVNAVSTGRIVIGNNIPAGTVTSLVNVPFSEIELLTHAGNPLITTVAVGDKIYVHQGVSVTAGGSSFDSLPNVAPNGGHVGTLFTWDELGRGDLYQMEWVVSLTDKSKPTDIFNYRSGTKTIDELIEHQILLPYAGKYTVEMIVYDTDNNFINEIKSNYVEAYVPEVKISHVTRYISDCANKWDDFYQDPIPEFEPTPSMLAPAPIEGVRYNWDNAYGRWVNPVFSQGSWDQAQLQWDRLDVGNLSSINNWNYPATAQSSILQISPVDNVEGAVLTYVDSLIDPLVLNPRIRLSGQRIYPTIEPAINPNDWIYICRGNTIYNLEVLYTDYTNPLYTDIYLTAVPPAAFRGGPTTWQVKREVAQTLALSGNQIYDEITNPAGIKIGGYVRLASPYDAPLRSRVNITGTDTMGVSDPNYIILNGGGLDTSYYPGGNLGKIYKYRNDSIANGNLVWDATPASSTWWIETQSLDPLVNDHVGKMFIVNALGAVGCLPALPISELLPGFSVITILVQLGGQLVYTQRLRVQQTYFDTSTMGNPFSIWSGAPAGYTGISSIDVIALDGGNLLGLNAQLTTWYGAGATIWCEYEYNEFPTRTYLGGNNGGNAEIYMDFNMYPAYGPFATTTVFPTTDTGWFYDHCTVEGDYTLLVTNTGLWHNGVGTLITVDDSNSELIRSSTSFNAYQRRFDEDYAENRLGTLIHQWKNYDIATWDDSCYHSWDSVDFQESVSCFFQLDTVAQNGSIKYNNDPAFAFQGIVGGMSNAEIASQALYELRANEFPGLSRFDYQVISTSPANVNFILGTLYTYQFPNDILSFAGTVSVGDVIVSPYTEPAAVVSAVGVNITMALPLPKKAQFAGSTTTGSPLITDVVGLLEEELYVGEIVTGSGLNAFPAAPSTVLDIIVSGGKIRQIRLSENATATASQSLLSVEWGIAAAQPNLAFQSLIQNGSFVIQAFAKTPSVDQLGSLVGANGVTFHDPVNGVSQPIGHTYSLKNAPLHFGYGVGKVGAFENGLSEYLMLNRNWQVYQYEGLNPLSLPGGWYPASDLPPAYSWLDNDPPPALPAFSNTLDAETQSNRLPYESGMGGPFRWEETRISTVNTSIPTGSSVIFTPDASEMAGKSRFLWRLYNSTELLVEIVDPTFMWTFLEQGDYSLELELADTNGNVKSGTEKNFVKVYELEK